MFIVNKFVLSDGHFNDNTVRTYLGPNKWSEPCYQWWLGKWNIICIAPIGAPAGVWEHCERGTEAYIRYLNEVMLAE